MQVLLDKYTVSQKNDTDVAHYNFHRRQPVFKKSFLAEMLLREYDIKWWFAIPPLLTNVSALPGETWTSGIKSF